MSSKKEEKGAADRIKAAALSAATKGMSRAQAERAATAAARNVNAYGQKEEGPSRWQERKEMKRKMYLLSTEKPVTMGQVKKDPKSKAVSTGETCQKCLQLGHWTYDCKNERVYVSRPTRSKVLKNPKLMQKMTTTHYPEFDHEEDSVLEKKRVEKEYKGGKKEKSKKRSKSKSKYRSDTESSSDREATSESDSDSRSESSTGSDYSSDGDRRRSKKKSKGSRKKYSSSSESSDYDSSSDSDSDSDSDSRKSRKKSKKHSRKR